MKKFVFILLILAVVICCTACSLPNKDIKSLSADSVEEVKSFAPPDIAANELLKGALLPEHLYFTKYRGLKR